MNPSIPPPPRRGVTVRAILLGLALVPINVYWLLVSELRWYMILTLNPLFVTPIFWLFGLVGLNAVVRWRRPQWALQPGELLTVYVMLALSCTVATHDFIINLVGGTLGWPAWFATPENQWERRLFPYLARDLLVWDRDKLEGAFMGHASLYADQNWLPWVKPLLHWYGFIFALFAALLCLNVLLRRAWVEQAKLAFPIVRLPLAVIGVESPGAFWRSGLMWAGFGLAVASGLLNGLHELYPVIPAFRTRARFLSFPRWPWTWFNGTVLSFYPFAIGLAFFVPLEVAFSCWFFYLFARLQYVLGDVLGYTRVQGFPFLTEQAIGGWTAYGLLLLYATRTHFREVGRILRRGGEGRERFTYGAALFGLVGSLAYLSCFWRRAGMTWTPLLIALASYFLLALGITRARAEAGSQHTVWDLEPKNLFSLVDPHLLGPRNLAGAALSHWFWRLNRSHVMPTQLEAFKMAQETRLPIRALLLPIILALGVAILWAPWACLDVLYRDGGLAKCLGFPRWAGHEAFGWLESALTMGYQPSTARWGAIGVAFAFVGLLFGLRARFIRFSLHPLGYCVGPGLYWLWCPFLVAWLIKWVIVRYGGLRAYRRAIPFFLGLVLGDYVTGSLWSLTGIALGIPTYQVFH